MSCTEINVFEEEKYVEIWLTRTEAANNSLRESLKSTYAKHKAMKHKVVVFESGVENLITNTKDLLRYELELQTRNDGIT